MQENTEPKTRPVTPWDKALVFARKNFAYLGILIVVILFLLYLIINGCSGNHLRVSVPAEWMEDFSSNFTPSQGSASYSFFGNLVRGLTEGHLIDYQLNELEFASPEEYDERRQDYLNNDSNIEWEIVPTEFRLRQNILPHSQATFVREGGLAEMKDDLRESVKRMADYGIKSFTGLDVPNFGVSNPHMSILFTDFFRFLQDSELMLNVTLAKSDQSPPYRLDTEKSRLPNRLRLELTGSSDKFNSPLEFRRSRTNPRRDVETGNAELGFYLKYKPVTPKPGLKEIDLSIGKVYLLYSPNLDRRELQWIYNQYVAPAVEDMQQRNPFIRTNSHWLPDQYPYVPPEVTELLLLVDQQKLTGARDPGRPVKIKVYYDTNDMREFVQQLQSKSASGTVKLIPGAAISPDAFMSETASLKEPVVYIYGVSLHSKYNLPVEVISRSFWYKAGKGDLYSDIHEIVNPFGARIVTSGQIDQREYQQYADLERELCLGSKTGRQGGLQPLFTVPYALIYKEKDITRQAFNTTRGWLELQSSRPTPQRR